MQSKVDFNGKTTTFAYDNMRRLMSKTPDASLNEATISFTYNNLGQRDAMTDASGTTNYLYDSRNRLQHKSSSNGTLSYTYDENGSIKTLRSNHANGVSADYAYDELNRLKQAKDNRLSGSQNTTYAYDAVGNLQSYSYPNQVTTSYGYNNLNRLTNLTVSNVTTGLASYQYTLGASGNRTQVVENTGRTVNYVYDDLYRLTSETIANSSNNGQISYQFDAVGNRLQRNSNVNLVANQTSTFDANDRINSDTFDNNGSTKISNGKSYNYDFENRLTSTSDGVSVVYDGDGNRVSKTAGGTTTNYLVDTNNLTGYAQVVEELQGGSVVKAYTYGLDLISQRQSLGVSFYNYDGHGSVRGLSSSLGNITDTYAYDAFGTLIERTGSTDNSYLYAGEQFDADLGFYYNRARYLNVSTGRFISQDSYEGSLFEPVTLHKYLYANNNPINIIDPSGNVGIHTQIVAVSILAVLSTMAVGMALYNFLTVWDVPVTVWTQPVVLKGSGWGQYEVDEALYRAAKIWREIANINFMMKPTIEVEIQELLRVKPPFGSSLVPNLGSHMTIFNWKVLGGDGVSGSTGDRAVSFIASRHTVFQHSGVILAHEWGHTLGLGHSSFGLMVPFSQFATSFISPDEKSKARRNATTAPYWNY